MRTLVKVSSKAAKNSNRAAHKHTHYGRAIIFGIFEIQKTFSHTSDALEWYHKVSHGWRAHIYDAMIYYDSYCQRPIINAYDAYQFARAKLYLGAADALELANAGAFAKNR